jgi:cytochrome b involved in lipid metabolism
MLTATVELISKLRAASTLLSGLPEPRAKGDMEVKELDIEIDEKMMSRRATIDSGIGADFDAYFPVEAEREEQHTDPETGLQLIGLDEVRDHCSPSDGWMVLYDRVYDVTGLLRSHPGGEEVMAEYLGYDGTMAFRGVGHSKAASRALQGCLVGILPKGERLNFMP